MALVAPYAAASALANASSDLPCLEGLQKMLEEILVDDPKTDDHEFEYDQMADEKMKRDGVRMDVATIAPPVPHAPHSTYGEFYSTYSDSWYLLERGEWYSLDVTTKAVGTEWIVQTEAGQTPMFHGTEFGAAYQILWQSQGFIAGEGTHKKNKTTYAGAWVVTSLADALFRANPRRYMTDDGAYFSRRSCPVVLEIRAAHLVKMKGNTTMH